MTVRKPLSVPKNRPVVIVGASGGGSTVVARQFPMWGNGAPMLFWAEQGLVWFEDGRDDCEPQNKFGHMNVRDALLRVQGVSEMILRSSEDRRWGEERRICQQFICEMEKVCRQAQEQGNPLENEDYFAEKRRRRPKTAIVPQVIDVPV